MEAKIENLIKEYKDDKLTLSKKLKTCQVILEGQISTQIETLNYVIEDLERLLIN